MSILTMTMHFSVKAQMHTNEEQSTAGNPEPAPSVGVKEELSMHLGSSQGREDIISTYISLARI